MYTASGDYIPGLRKKDLFIYWIEQNVYNVHIHILFLLLFLNTLFAVFKQSLQINITIVVSELFAPHIRTMLYIGSYPPPPEDGPHGETQYRLVFECQGLCMSTLTWVL